MSTVDWDRELTALALAAEPDLRALIPLATNAVRSPLSKKAYGRALCRFFDWYQSGPFCRRLVQAYRAHMEEHVGPATVNLALSAIRCLAREAAACGYLDQQVASGIDSLPGARQLGNRTGDWLDRRQAEDLIRRPDRQTLHGKRDAVVVGLLVGCGLRRAECARLTVGHIQMRDGRPCIVDMVGKGGRIRTVPVPAWCYADIQAWLAAAGLTEGLVLRAISKADVVSAEGISQERIFQIAERYAGVGPHDLRRTHAKLARAGGAELDQIQASLGHSSVTTTQRYVGGNQNLKDAPCDRLGISIQPDPPPTPATSFTSASTPGQAR